MSGAPAQPDTSTNAPDPAGAAAATPQAPTAAAGPAPPAPQAPAPAGPLLDAVEVRVTIANLRNGEVKDITSAAPRSSIPSAYKWVHIAQMAPADYATYVGEVIRATYAQVLASHGGVPSDVERKSAKNTAIVLGSVRAGAAAALQLTQPDLAGNEVVGSGSTLQGGTVSAGAGTAGARYATARSMEPFTATEVSVINTVMYLGMAVPILQGVSLMLSGHHFIPPTRNIFMGMKKQAIQASGSDVTQWIDNMGDAFDDCAFHKACHPILMPLKRGWAKQEAMAAKLKASGHGAAAIRLPAIPSDAHAGKASLAIITRARPVVLGMGHTCSVDIVAKLIRDVEHAPEGMEEMRAVEAVRAWYEANKASISFCAGIVAAIKDSTGGGSDTTLRAYSVRKVIADNPADNANGASYARSYLARQREAAINNTYADPRIVV